ncbi:MAG: LPS-assembly protein LptD [Verrucomicrobia bacterium]|nr:LPS-assembly protein LptD [Verrucomicrobiota bacterium]
MERKNTLIVALLMAFCSCGAFGATPESPFSVLDQPSPAMDDNTPIEVDAEELDYDKHSGRITAAGNVVITCGIDELRADKVIVYMNSGEAYALGNVVLKRGDTETRATKLQYNFRTRVSSLDDPEIDASPYNVLAKKVTRAAHNEYVLHNAKVTTCVMRHPHSHYHIRARRITVVPGEYIRANGAVWAFGRLPCMYLPFWHHSLSDDSGFRFRPGYRSRMGGYLLSSYYHTLRPGLRAEHHVDYRTRRGFAVGEDLTWNAPGATGALKLYYLSDDQPIDDDEDAATSDIDSQRYRIHLDHNQSLDERTLLLMQLNYLSDTDVIEDFFNREYRAVRQPENYISLSHQREHFSVSALLNARLNDFYSNVDRLPEVTIDFMRQQLGRSSFYYEGQTQAARLERVWMDSLSGEDYASIRFDTEHMVYQPRRYFGWLNLVPRVGYRGTYYSDTKETVTTESVSTTNTTTTTVVGGVTNTVTSAVTSTNSVSTDVARGAELRNLFEVGAEASFKTFKVWEDWGENRIDLRHILEPYANYTLRMNSGVEPVDLYQFDSVDALGELHQILIGARNKLQVKRNGRPHDLIDLDTYTRLKFNAEDDEQVLEKFYVDAEFRPNQWLSFDVDGIFSVEESSLEQINTRFNLSQKDEWLARVEHRYRADESNLIAGLLTLYPSQRWAYNAFARYEFEQSRVQEVGGYVQRKLDCLCVRLGGSALPGFTRSNGTEQDDDYRVMLEFWLTAFPGMALSSKSGY